MTGFVGSSYRQGPIRSAPATTGMNPSTVRQALESGAIGRCMICEKYESGSAQDMEYHIVHYHNAGSLDQYVEVLADRRQKEIDPRKIVGKFKIVKKEDGTRSYVCNGCGQAHRFKTQAENCLQSHSIYFAKLHSCASCKRYDDEHGTDAYSLQYCLGFTKDPKEAFIAKARFIAKRLGLPLTIDDYSDQGDPCFAVFTVQPITHQGKVYTKTVTFENNSRMQFDDFESLFMSTKKGVETGGIYDTMDKLLWALEYKLSPHDYAGSGPHWLRFVAEGSA